MIAFWALLKGLPWRAIGAAGLVVAVALAGWRISTWRDAYRTLPGVQDALAREEACQDGSKCFERQRAFTEAVGHETTRIVTDYEAALAEIRDRPPAPAVRLCRPARPGPVRDAAPAGPVDGVPAGRDVPLETSGDIGQRLFDLIDACDAEVLKLRYLQGWNKALSKP